MIAACCLLCQSSHLVAQSVNTTNTLTIGTQVVAPFAMKRPDGSWAGISIDLWRHIADQLHLKYEFRELPFNALLDSAASNRIDAAIGAITITADRQKKVDFTHAYYNSGLAIAIRRVPNEHHLLASLSDLLTAGFLKLVLAVLLVMAAAGTSVWLLERKANRAEFGGRWWQGLGSGFWWSASAMTTTGYGDKTPRTFAGRLVAVFWMFAGLIIISSFTAAVTASLTVRHFTQYIHNFEDLAHHRVAVIRDTTSESYLRQHHIAAVPYPNGETALEALVKGHVDAFVNDTPLLLYSANQMQDSIVVLQQTFDPQGYGIALPSGSPLYKSIDIALLEITSDPHWEEALSHYLGAAEK